MTSPNIPRVIEFLGAHPKGVYGWQIAAHLETPLSSMGQTLALMAERRQIVAIVQVASRANSTWRLANQDETATPPVFRACEILHAFQDAARQRLNVRVMEVA